MKPELKQIRTLTLALFFSGAINILLVALLFFWAFYERPPTPYCELKPKEALRAIVVSPTNSSLLQQYKAMTYEQLLVKLNKTGLVEDGFTERDLALGVLVAFHDFNLEKAMGGDLQPTQKRSLSFNEGQERVNVFPGLSDAQLESIKFFAKTEKWPFKTRGLLLLLKKEQLAEDTSLAEAFYLTQEFSSVNELFKGLNFEREDILKMLQEGDWGTLSAFNEKQKTVRDLSVENRERLLLTYLKQGSKTAAALLLKSDYEFATKRLSDATVLIIMRLLENSPDSLRYLGTIAASPRGDQVKSLAVARYEELSGKKWEPLVSRETVKQPLEKVIAIKPPPKAITKAPVKKPIVAAASRKKELLYIVQDGDSLWKIAKRFKVSIDALRNSNKLKSDILKPGTPLKIPDSKALKTA